MGASCGKQYTMTIEFNSVVKSSNRQFPDLSQVREWILERFPSIRCLSYSITVPTLKMQIRNHEDYSLAIKKSRKSLRMVVTLDKRLKLTNQILENISKGILKIRQKGHDLEATGTLIAHNLILTTAEQLREKANLRDYSVLSSDNREILFKEDGIFIGIGEPPHFHFVVAEIDSHSTLNDLPLIKLQKEFKGDTTEEATVVYFTKQRPIIQEITGQIQTLSFPYFTLVGLNLREGSSGAPIFNQKGELIGLYSPYLPVGSAVSIKFITSELLKNSLGDSGWGLAVRELDNFSGLFMDDMEENQADNESECSERVPELGPCFYRKEDSLLFYFNEHELFKREISLKNGTGDVAVSCGSYVILTGKNNENEYKSAWKIDKQGVIELPSMKQPHKYHSSVYFNKKLYIFSGKYTRKCESWDESKRQWSAETALPHSILHNSACAYVDKIYLLGGIVDQEYSNTILCYFESIWDELVIQLPFNAINIGTFCTEDNRIFILGGYIAEDSEPCANHLAWKLNIETGETQSFPLKGHLVFNGSSFQTTEPVFSHFSATGDYIQYDTNKVFSVSHHLLDS